MSEMSEPPVFCIPFRISNAYQGFAVVNGLIKTTGDALILQYETKDSLVGMLKSGLREVRIPFKELAGIDLKANWFRTTLVIRTKDMTPLQDLSSSRPAEVALKLERKDRQSAKGLVTALRLSVAESELRRLNSAV
jgi:hypothetical protein